MTTEQKRRPVACPEDWLTAIDRHAGCSDRFFSKLYTARAGGFLSTGILEALQAETEEEEEDEQEERMPV